jgi:hypothetical protein
MKGKTHQNLKACVRWKSSDGRWSFVELSMKGKGGRVAKKERNSGGRGGRLQLQFKIQE